MPSSMIFMSLIVLWLLILVPTIARRRQEVVRPTLAALSGRVLTRTVAGQDVEREKEIMATTNTQPSRPRRTSGDAAPDHRHDYRHDIEHRQDFEHRHDVEYSDDPGPEWADDRAWERPPARYRPGRGGYDPDAAASTARSRHVFRQRVVLALLAAALITGLVAGLALPVLWWAHAGVGLALVGYLVYLRRQVRMEDAIRLRRAQRMAGTRRPAAADDPELDAWARRGRDATRPSGSAEAGAHRGDEDLHFTDDPGHDHDHDQDDPDGHVEDWGGPADPDRVRGTGEPVGLLESRGTIEGEPALPRLRPVPVPPPPAGTVLVGADDDDPDAHDLAGPTGPSHRRAVGQ